MTHNLPRLTLFTQFWNNDVKKLITNLKFETLTTKLSQVHTEAVAYRSYGKKGVVRNFAKITGKKLYQSFFFNKVSEIIDVGTGVFL